MRLYNTLTRSIEDLPPPPGPIRMYFCGPTVYQRAHIGNARPFVLGMWLRTWLRLRGYDATLVHNITDVNDRIYEAAPDASAQLAARATEWYLQDTADLGLGMPDALPKATDSIPQIVTFIEQLIAGGHAYAVEGDVYFRVASDPQYGRLSGQRPDQVEEQEPNPLKEDPRDFALWKANKPGEDTSWDAPWGRGRPGWHIECSAMAEDAFGPAFEIHGGGLDLVFPHHENELAQSSALGHEFARIWTHNGMLDRGGEKMSKSLGNDTSLRNVLDTWGREVVLLFFMTGALAQADGLQRRGARAGEGAGRVVPQRLPLAERAGRRVGCVRGGARRRLQHAGGAGAHARLARPRSAPPRARRVRPRLARRRRRAHLRRSSRSPSGGRPPGRRRTSPRPTGSATSSRPPAGRRATRRAASGSSGCEPRAGLRPPPRPGGAARPARGARAVGDRAGGEVRVVAPGRRAAARPGQARPRPERGGRHARPSGRARVVRAVPVRRRVRARRRPSGRCSPASTR